MIGAMLIMLLTSPAMAGDYDNRRAEEYINLGFKHIEAGDYNKAESALKKAVRLSRDNARAYAGLGLIYLKLGDNDVMTQPQLIHEAIISAEKALSLGEDTPEVRYILGICHLILNDKESAIEEYELLEGLDSTLAQRLYEKIANLRIRSNFTEADKTMIRLGKPDTSAVSRKCKPDEYFGITFRECYKAEESLEAGEKEKKTHTYSEMKLTI
jgi:tetratricopeptide (TPR) repeat protein